MVSTTRICALAIIIIDIALLVDAVAVHSQLSFSYGKRIGNDGVYRRWLSLPYRGKYTYLKPIVARVDENYDNGRERSSDDDSPMLHSRHDMNEVLGSDQLAQSFSRFIQMAYPPKYFWHFAKDSDNNIMFHMVSHENDRLSQSLFDKTKFFVCPSEYHVDGVNDKCIRLGNSAVSHASLSHSFYSFDDKPERKSSKIVPLIEAYTMNDVHDNTLLWIVVAVVPTDNDSAIFIPSPNVRIWHDDAFGPDPTFYRLAKWTVDDDLFDMKRIASLPPPLSYQDVINIFRPEEVSIHGFEVKYKRMKRGLNGHKLVSMLTREDRVKARRNINDAYEILKTFLK